MRVLKERKNPATPKTCGPRPAMGTVIFRGVGGEGGSAPLLVRLRLFLLVLLQDDDDSGLITGGTYYSCTTIHVGGRAGFDMKKEGGQHHTRAWAFM